VEEATLQEGRFLLRPRIARQRGRVVGLLAGSGAEQPLVRADADRPISMYPAALRERLAVRAPQVLADESLRLALGALEHPVHALRDERRVAGFAFLGRPAAGEHDEPQQDERDPGCCPHRLILARAGR